MKFISGRAVGTALIASLALAAQASAHAEISPPTVQKGDAQVFTLAVPTEEEGATTTSVQLTVPDGFGIDSFVAAPGWKRSVQATGKGEEAVVQQVTWTGGSTPTGEDSAFSFLASPTKEGDYTFKVRQTYSNGKVVDWSGAEDSDTPSPTITAVSDLGGGGGSDTLAIVALILAGLALLIAIGAFVSKSGRPLT